MKIFNRYKNIIICGVLLLAAVMIVYYVRNPLEPRLAINSHVITYETAITSQQITHGLSDRDPLPENHGMLFIFDHKEQYSFWMKDMKFPLDMIWIDDKVIVDISKNVPVPVVGQNLPIYTPKRQVNRVLEVNAGTADRLGIKVDDTIEFLRK
jgi:uncharacterized membrane protein (UPF0127 family)